MTAAAPATRATWSTPPTRGAGRRAVPQGPRRPGSRWSASWRTSAAGWPAGERHPDVYVNGAARTPAPQRRSTPRSRTWRRPATSNDEKGQCHEDRLPPRVPRGDARHGRAGGGGARELPGARAARARQDARVAAQRLRVLPRHALQGRPRARRDRAAALRAGRLARGAVLQRARARGAGLVRGAHAAARERRAGRRVRGGRAPVRRGGGRRR